MGLNLHRGVLQNNTDLITPKTFSAEPTGRQDGTAVQAGDMAYSDGTSSTNQFGTSGAGLYYYNGSAWVHVVGGAVSTTLTIASGTIAPDRSSHLVDTEAAAASDDLTTINGTNFKAGDILTLAAANGARDVVIKASGGNILLPNDLDITLDDIEKTVILRFDGTNWNYVAGGSSISPIIPNSIVATILPIATGVIVPTRASHIIAAESGTADDLVTVTTTNFKAGDTIKISPDTGDTITIKASGGNITTDTGLDIVLDAVTDYAWLHVTASGVVASLPGRAPEYRYIFAADYGVVGAASVGAATAQDTAFALAVAALNAGGGGTLVLPGGVIRLDAQHTFDVSGCHIVGRGRSGLSGSAEATILDLRYNSGPPLIFGNGSTYRRDMSLRSVHIECANGAISQPAIRTRYVRGITFDDLSLGGVYTFLEAGQAGEPTSFIHLGDIEGNAPASHSHFVNFINAPGPVWIADELHYEGQNAANAYCFNWSTTSVATDGLQVGACTVRLFERIFNCRPGLANWVINGAVLDYYEFYGFYADTDVGSINKIIFTSCQVNGDPSAVASFMCGFYLAQSTSAAYDVSLANNEFYVSGGPAAWITGNVTVNSIGNIARDCGQATNATYSSFRYGSSVKGAAVGNTSRSNSANKVNYGHHFEGDANGTDFYLDERSNVSLGHVTRACGFTVLPRRATQFVLRIRNNGGVIEHSFVSVSRNDSLPGGTFISAIQNPTSAWTVSPTGADASTAMAAGAKIATSISKMMALDTADLNNNYDFVMARIDPLNTTTTGITKVNSRIDSYSINGVTRSRLGIRFDADINTTNITAGQELWVECHGQMKGYY